MEMIYNVIKTEVVDGSENVTEKSIVASFTDKEVAQDFVNKLECWDNDWCSYDIESKSVSTGFVTVTDIDWDVDDEEDLEDLPSKVVIPNGELNFDKELEEAVGDWLSDTYGFCHNSFVYDEN